MQYRQSAMAFSSGGMVSSCRELLCFRNSTKFPIFQVRCNARRKRQPQIGGVCGCAGCA